jgi:parallel beta-helix repeat protein
MKGLFRKVLTIGFAVIFLVAIGSAFFERNMVAYASGPIYIRADGSIEGTTDIVSDDNVTYVFTADINDCDFMYVQRSNIIVDGNGYVLNSSGLDEDGISVMFVNNVTIKNVGVQGFGFGIYLFDAANNTISGNNVTENNYAGIGINSCGNNAVSGNTVTGNNEYGIYLYSSSNHNSISGNNIRSNNIGVSLDSSLNNTINGNNIMDSFDGVYLHYSLNNSISRNAIKDNVDYGVYLDSSSNNSITGNNMTANNNGGIYLAGSSDNVISGNKIGNSPNQHIALEYSSNSNRVFGNNLTNSTADVGVYVYGSSLNSFLGNNVTSNADSGIRVDASSDSVFSENNISENLNGIYLWYSSNITVSGDGITANNASGIVLDSSNINHLNGNNIANNGNHGVYVAWSSDNHIYHNNFVNNANQTYVTPDYNNSWDNGYPSGGNYWSEYADVDDNSGPGQNITGVPDGIWDHPYGIDANNTDHYPLKFAYETQPPTITILSPENKTYAVNASISLTFTVDEFVSWMSYSLNGQADVTITGNTTLPTLSDGWHHVAVYANDTFGNMGMSIVYFTVDTVEPDITDVMQNPLTDILPDTVVRINATVTDATSGVKQVLLNCTFTNGTDTWNTVFSMTHLVGDVWNGTILAHPYGTNVTYVIIAEDNAGNIITTEQIYEYKYEYQVVPEFPLAAILFAFATATTLLIVVVSGRKRYFPLETK